MTQSRSFRSIGGGGNRTPVPCTETPVKATVSKTGGAESGALEAPDGQKSVTPPGPDNPVDPLANIAKAIGQLSQADRQRLIDLLVGTDKPKTMLGSGPERGQDGVGRGIGAGNDPGHPRV